MNLELLAKVQDAERMYVLKDKKIQALAHASCTISPRDRIAVMGPSGSGKSTLLHLIGGIDAPSAGELTWPLYDGKVDFRPGFAGIVFQMQSMVPSLTIAENVEMPLLITGMNHKAAMEKALNMLERFELYELAAKLPEELSGGQLQRAALARALVCDPKLLLADEPTGQLDHPTARHLFGILLDYLKDTDTALVVATHDREIAELMQKTWTINHGILEADDVI